MARIRLPRAAALALAAGLIGPALIPAHAQDTTGQDTAAQDTAAQDTPPQDTRGDKGHPEVKRDLAAIAAGGRLYDNWMVALDEPAPEGPHPLYPADGPLAHEPAETWRCVACHGWDDKGVAGQPGMTALQNAPLSRILAVRNTPAHKPYADYLPEEARAKLAAFIAYGQVPTDAMTASPAADAAPPKALYATICANCHGPTGQSLPGIPALGDVARDQPALVFHKTLNGHPGAVMPSLRAVGVAAVGSLLTYLQTLPPEDTLAAVVRGGRLYDNWMAELDLAAPKGVAPGFSTAQVKTLGAANTWRCAECHGWDYRGKAGAPDLGAGAGESQDAGPETHVPGPGLTDLDGRDPRAVLTALEDEIHAPLHRLSLRARHDLAAFLTRGQMAPDMFLDGATFSGDGPAHQAHFETLCAPCHGLKGADLRTMPPLGRVTKRNPWKALHKTLNGHPDENMPALRALSPTMVSGILAYTQSLPSDR